MPEVADALDRLQKSLGDTPIQTGHKMLLDDLPLLILGLE